MKKQTQSRILVFALAFLVWLALTAGGGVQEVVAGVVVAIIVRAANAPPTTNLRITTSSNAPRVATKKGGRAPLQQPP